jgi:hypothetical protein
MNAVENYKSGNEQYAEIVRSKRTCAKYMNLKDKINIKLFRGLDVELAFAAFDPEVRRTLSNQEQLIKTGECVDWRHVAMLPGDIELQFADTPLSEKLTKHFLYKKTGAIIKGEDFFIERTAPGARGGKRYSLILASQDDIKNIFESLTQIL